jgi:hypothetical protein
VHDAVASLDVIIELVEGQPAAGAEIFLHCDIQGWTLEVFGQQLAIQFELAADGGQEQLFVGAGHLS